jgi:hypothetical protein
MRDGLSSWCAACHVEANRRWRAENPDKVAAANEARRVVPAFVHDRELGHRIPNPSPRPKSKVW